MKKRQLIIYLLIAAVLAGLIYLQVHSWRRFDWPLFFQQTKDMHWGMVAFALGLIYLDYFLRALRWKLLLSPVKKVSVASLTPPQFIGFTALALLGRPGE